MLEMVLFLDFTRINVAFFFLRKTVGHICMKESKTPDRPLKIVLPFGGYGQPFVTERM